MTHKTALLMLDDGTCFEGTACGACQEAAGEVVFSTGMCGYQEVLTDPSSGGHIFAFTAAHMGNYGTNAHDDEAPGISASGAVFHDLFTGAEGIPFPHWQADSSLDKKLREAGVSGIYGIDTRALTLYLRQHGVRNGIISAVDLNKESLLERAKALPSIQGRALDEGAGQGERYTFKPMADSGWPVRVAPDSQPERELKIAVLDFGVKRSILMHLCASAFIPELFPAASSAEDILNSKADAVLISNGPGDPAAYTGAIKTAAEIWGKFPMLGIGLGYQLMGLSQGAKSFKMPVGHRGANHSVQDVKTGKVIITRQNHGFCLDPASLPAQLKPSFWNLNDNSLEGFEALPARALGVQYHPASNPGEWNENGLFQSFRRLVLGI